MIYTNIQKLIFSQAREIWFVYKKKNLRYYIFLLFRKSNDELINHLWNTDVILVQFRKPYKILRYVWFHCHFDSIIFYTLIISKNDEWIKRVVYNLLRMIEQGNC